LDFSAYISLSEINLCNGTGDVEDYKQHANIAVSRSSKSGLFFYL